jgi:hypothetical protein
MICASLTTLYTRIRLLPMTTTPTAEVRKPLVLKRLPMFWTQRKTAEKVLVNSKHSSKSLADFKNGVTPKEETTLPTLKYRPKPLSKKQIDARKRMAIACTNLERQNALDSAKARQQKKEREFTGIENKLGKCKDCGLIVHRGSTHTEYHCVSAIMQGKKAISTLVFE